ncbi:MAG: thiamine diphosphokinase [Erysipelotrichales bacterium]|nr:thiamine diphosphokinase [Erysipelotrichales bacterium]
MEPKVTLVAKMAETIDVNGPFIGVDRGALTLAKNERKMVAASGDFDSVDVNELTEIKNWCADFVLLPREKDETDSESAIEYALKQFEKVVLYGACNGRADHFLANIMLVHRYQGKVELLDDKNHVRFLKEGIHMVPKCKYPYLSFITFEGCELSIEGVSYPLTHKEIRMGDIFTISNEIVSEEATITIYKGTVICLECMD